MRRESRSAGAASKRHAAVRSTVIGDCEALWCLSGQAIRILRVHTATGTTLSVTSAERAPDLADMRERFPGLTPLWDAVRHQFWTHTDGEGAGG